MRGRLRDSRVSDVAHLACAVIFVVGASVKVGDNLYAENEYRENQRS